MILLDTNICIAILHANTKVLNHLRLVRDSIGIPAMVAGELYYGAAKSDYVEHNIRQTEEFLGVVNIVHSNTGIMRRFGFLKATLEKQGMPIDDADALIAATALERHAVLITGNTRHFNRVADLTIKNWFD